MSANAQDDIVVNHTAVVGEGSYGKVCLATLAQDPDRRQYCLKTTREFYGTRDRPLFREVLNMNCNVHAGELSPSLKQFSVLTPP